MKNKFLLVMTTFFGVVLFSARANAGKIVLANDEWTLSNTGFTSLSDPNQFAQNVTSWFTGGSGGNFLAYSTNFGLTQNQLSNSITSAGHTWTVSTVGSFDLTTLSAYDGVFLAGNSADNQVLINYVNGGGNVYLAGGTGWGGALNEANQWNAFLNAFGLGFGTTYNGVQGDIAINSSHSIFANVDHLYQNNGNDALDIVSSDPRAQVLISQNGHGLYAVYDSGTVPIPEPTTVALFGAGIVFLAGIGMRRKKK